MRLLATTTHVFGRQARTPVETEVNWGERQRLSNLLVIAESHPHNHNLTTFTLNFTSNNLIKPTCDVYTSSVPLKSHYIHLYNEKNALC